MGIEAQIVLWIQDVWRQPWLDPIMIGITNLAEKGWFWIASILVCLCIKKTRKAGIYALVSLLLTFLIGNIALKHLVARVRPYDAIAGLHSLVPSLSDYSFPSAHTSISFSVALIYYHCFSKKTGILFLILAALIALSRLYVGVHYPTDILGGFVLALTVTSIVKRFWINKQGEI